MIVLLEWIGEFFIRLFEATGLWFVFLWRPIKTLFRPPVDVAEWLRQMVHVGTDSIPVVFLTTLFTGMVMALQTYTGFHRERHPLAASGVIPDTVVMVYGPRDEREIEIVWSILLTSYGFARGRRMNE